MIERMRRPIDPDVIIGRFVERPPGAAWTTNATRTERAEAIRRLLALAEPGDELTQAEHDLQLLGVDPVELFFAAVPVDR